MQETLKTKTRGDTYECSSGLFQELAAALGDLYFFLEGALKGEGKYRFWTMKALERAGYITDDNDRGLLVEAPSESDPFWSCSSDSGTRNFENIYELIRWLGRKQIIC